MFFSGVTWTLFSAVVLFAAIGEIRNAKASRWKAALGGATLLAWALVTVVQIVWLPQ